MPLLNFLRHHQSHLPHPHFGMMPGMVLPPPGAMPPGDTVPAMLSPGETVLPAPGAPKGQSFVTPQGVLHAQSGAQVGASPWTMNPLPPDPHGGQQGNFQEQGQISAKPPVRFLGPPIRQSPPNYQGGGAQIDSQQWPSQPNAQPPAGVRFLGPPIRLGGNPMEGNNQQQGNQLGTGGGFQNVRPPSPMVQEALRRRAMNLRGGGNRWG